MNEKLIKYFAGEMNPSEKEEFEETINESPSLQEEFVKYSNFFSNINETKNPEVEENYFINLIPEFRNKLGQRRGKKYHPVFSFTTAVLAVIIIFLFIPNNEKIVEEGNNIVDNYSTSEITNFLDINSEQPVVTNLQVDVGADYDSLLDDIIFKELNINEKNLVAAEMIDRLDYNTILQSVNQEEASVIYKELKNKKIF